MKVHACRRAAYTSEPTMQRPPYGLPIEYTEIGIFRMTDDSIYPFRPNAIRSSFRVHLGLIFGLLSGPRFDSSRIGGLIPRTLSVPRFALPGKGGLIPELLSGPRCDPSRRKGLMQNSFWVPDVTLIFSKVRASSRQISCGSSLRCLRAAPR